jgi:hypothetical protein
MSTNRIDGRPIVEVVGDHGELLATINCFADEHNTNSIHIVSNKFADPIFHFTGAEYGVPGYLIRFLKRS